MMHNSIYYISARMAAAVLGALCVSACDGSTVKDTLGLYRSAPDEYTVVSRPPLSVPPQFGLQPPSNSSRLGRTSASTQAESLVMGGTVSEGAAVRSDAVTIIKKGAPVGVSKAESVFLRNAGAEQADPMVREKLAEEYYERVTQEESKGWLDSLDMLSRDKDPLVNAKKEAERIQKNEDAGKPVTEGETPEVRSGDHGVLGDLLGW